MFSSTSTPRESCQVQDCISAPLSISVWPFLYNLSHRKSVQFAFGSVSEILVVCIAVVLLCPRKEESPWSSYSAMLIWNSVVKPFYNPIIWNKDSNFSTSLATLVFRVFLILAILMSVKWYLIVIWFILLWWLAKLNIFPILIDHLYITFGKMTLPVFFPFLIELFDFVAAEL